MPSCLHLVLSANALADCLAMTSAGDAVLFLADGVMTLLDGGPAVFDDGIERMYSRIDVQARGLAELAAQRSVRQVEDDRLPELLCTHCHCLSWK